MPSLPDLTALTSEIERRIGRNVLLYQRIELDLKKLDRLARLSGTVSELPKVAEEAHERSKGHTMGGAVSRFLETAASKLSEKEVDLKEDSIHIAFHWNIEEDDQSRQASEERLRIVVNDRNRLAHAILKEFDLALPQDCEDLLKWLDSAHESALGAAREVDRIMDVAGLLFSALKVPEVRNLMVDPQAVPPEEIRISWRRNCASLSP